ncbi:hypothetical protein MTR67_044400 [Solanum verrucosum]|uniref:Uncharacterized protein n=1 Tax=Solanum verrucosum TaxID=315347 RepID=A0AAF0US56_SOLVR|nr:hypothetical protein MTR67_044400 [Solanum verrucosum]
MRCSEFEEFRPGVVDSSETLRGVSNVVCEQELLNEDLSSLKAPGATGQGTTCATMGCSALDEPWGSDREDYLGVWRQSLGSLDIASRPRPQP